MIHLSEPMANLLHFLCDSVVLLVVLGTCVAAFVFYKIFKNDLDLRE